MIEGPYKLPKGWRWVRLGEVCTYERQTIDPRRYPHQEFLLFSIPAYDNNKQPELRKGSEIGSLKLKIKPNICLFSKLNPRIPRAWVIKSDESISDLPMLASTEFLALRPYTHLIDLDYLGLSLLSNVFLSQFQVGVTGATSSRQRLKQEDVLNALIPLPPLEEQKRIVARIEELMDRIKEAKKLRQETKKQTELLWQSVLAETFPQLGTQLPNGWRWVRLGEIATVFSGTWGKDPSSQGSDEEALVRVIRVSDIKETLTIDYASVPWRCVTQKEVKRLALRDGDVIVVKSSGSQAKVISGRAALFEQQPEIFLPSNFVFAVRCNAKEVAPRFLWCWLNSEPLKQVIKQMVATFTYPNLKKSDYVKLPIPLPPLEEQKRIANYLQEVHEKIKELKEVQAKTEEEIKLLEQSILEKAFRGEL
jgi:type I restriction enzyme S subunit